MKKELEESPKRDDAVMKFILDIKRKIGDIDITRSWAREGVDMFRVLDAGDEIATISINHNRTRPVIHVYSSDANWKPKIWPIKPEVVVKFLEKLRKANAS